MKAKLKGDLKTLFEQKATFVRSNMIEYIEHYKHANTYRICCVGINSYGCCFKGSIHSCLNDSFYFQHDLDDTYLAVKENPILIYND